MCVGWEVRWGQVPFVRFLFVAIAGISLSCWIEPTLIVHRIILVLLVGLGACCLMSLGKSLIFSRLFLLFIVFFCWHNAWEGHPATDLAHFSHFDQEYLYGYVMDEPIQGEERVRFRLFVLGGVSGGEDDMLLVKPLSMRGQIQVTAEGVFELEYGDRVYIPARYNPVAPPRNPGEMDYAAHLAKQNCWHQVYLSEGQLHLLDGNVGHPFLAKALEIRRKMVEKFGRYMPEGGDAFAIASTLILGYRADLSRELFETYSVTGTIHVLSVSGMHVVIVFWLLAAMLFWMDRNKVLKALRFPLLIMAVWAYAFLTGLSPSVMRAAMMLSFVLWAAAGGRRSITYNNIAASAFFLLLFEPKLLLDLGFQLSYLAVVGIVFFNPIILGLYQVRIRILRPISDYSAMSIAAQAGAFPLAMYYFQQFPVYFLLANLLIVLPASGIMYLGFALLLIPETALTQPLLQIFGFLLSGLIDAVNGGLYWIQALPAASLQGLQITWWECVLIYICMLSLVLAYTRRSKQMLWSCLSCLLILWATTAVKQYHKWMDRTLIIHQMRSQLAISYTGRGRVWLYSNLEDSSHGSLTYSVWPYLRRYADRENVPFIAMGERHQEADLLIGPGRIQVGVHSLGIYDEAQWVMDRELNGAGNDSKWCLDLLLIRNNPEHSLEEILAWYPARKLIFDGSNYPRTLSQMVHEAENLQVEYEVLKDNFAYIWVMD